MGILDCGCTKNVTGEVWLDEFINELSEEDKSLVEDEKTHTKFKFGDEKEVVSTREVKFPCVVGSKTVMVKANVVMCDIHFFRVEML